MQIYHNFTWLTAFVFNTYTFYNAFSELDEYKRSSRLVATVVIPLVLAVVFLFSGFVAVATEVLSPLRNLYSRAKWSFLPQT